MTEGSSPLSRGILGGQAASHRGAGIIPALAGNTFALTSVMMVAPDHPRSRGEYIHPNIHRHEYLGSSPLSRGIQASQVISTTHVRIIPALAGNTRSWYKLDCGLADHPRSRGEYNRFLWISPTVTGSSPLSRGIRRGQSFNNGPRGIIPALAGNTMSCHIGSSGGRDHPRSRGEYPRPSRR